MAIMKEPCGRGSTFDTQWFSSKQNKQKHPGHDQTLSFAMFPDGYKLLF